MLYFIVMLVYLNVNLFTIKYRGCDQNVSSSHATIIDQTCQSILFVMCTIHLCHGKEG